MTRNHKRKVTNTRIRSNETRAIDVDEDETNVGFYPNELQPNVVQNDPDMRVPLNEQGPEPEREQEQAIIVADAQDHDTSEPPDDVAETEPAGSIHDDVTLSPDVEPPQRPQRTRLPPTRLMYSIPGQPANYHVNYIHQIPRYVVPFQQTAQMIPFMPGYVPSHRQLFMTPRMQFRYPEPSYPQQLLNSFTIPV